MLASHRGTCRNSSATFHLNFQFNIYFHTLSNYLIFSFVESCSFKLSSEKLFTIYLRYKVGARFLYKLNNGSLWEIYKRQKKKMRLKRGGKFQLAKKTAQLFFRLNFSLSIIRLFPARVQSSKSRSYLVNYTLAISRSEIRSKREYPFLISLINHSNRVSINVSKVPVESSSPRTRRFRERTT